MSLKVKLQKDPPPPPGISKEEQRVWSGWFEMTDREVVREAAVKGLHVKLAITFLSVRNKLDYESSELFFKEEVNRWVLELLNRRQIFRASHVLNNIKLDPHVELTQIFVETDNKELRNYVGEHLNKLGKINPSLMKSWDLLSAVEESKDILSEEESAVTKISSLNRKDHNWKCKVGTKLFFHTFESKLEHYLNRDIIWCYLLKNNCKDLLKFWIQLSFNKNGDTECDLINIKDETKEVLRRIFSTLPLEEEMIDVNSCNDDIETDVKEFILNELCKFGVFCSSEASDILSIIRRVAKAKGITRLYELIKQKELEHFSRQLIKHCVENEHYVPLNYIINNPHFSAVNVDDISSPHLDLILSTKRLASDFKNDGNLIENISKFVKYLSNGDMQLYFMENPLIFLTLILFNNKNLLLPIMEKKSEFLDDFEVNYEFLTKVSKKLPFLKAVIDELTDEESKEVTVYDLLEKHSDLNVRQVFSFRFSNTSYPTFSANSFSQEAYNKKVIFLTYLQQEQPSIAALVFYNTFVTETKPDIVLEKTVRKVEKFAFKNYCNRKLTTACFAFLNMIGQNCQNLRTHIHIANMLNEANHKCSIKNYRFMDLTPDDIVDTIEKYYEKSVTNLIEDFKSETLIDVLKKYKVVISYSRFHQVKYPELLLTRLAENDLWLPFLIVIQFFNYPEGQVQKLCSKFKSAALAEHLQHSLCNDIKFEIEKDSIMKERNSRNYFLSRIGVRKAVDSSSVIIDQGYASTSITSQTSSTETSSASSGISEYELEMPPLGANIDLLKILVKCHNSSDPPKMLLQACQLYKYPLFAVFATSYEPDSFATNWLTWLSVSADMEIEYCASEDLVYNAKSVQKLLIDVLKRKFYNTLLESFQIFLPDNPLKIFLEVIVHWAEGDFDELYTFRKLDGFINQTNILKNSYVELEVDHEISYLKNRLWVESTAILLLASTLDNIITSSYQQMQLLQLLVKFEIEKHLLVPVHDLSKMLSVVKSIFKYRCYVRLIFSEVLYGHESANSIKCYIDELIENKQYKTAFEIGSIEGVSLDHIILQKWEDDFDKNRNDINFWETCLEELANVQQKIEVIALLEKCCKKATDNFEKYKILQVAFHWAKTYNLPNIFAIERKLWLSFLHLRNYDLQFTLFADSEPLFYSQMKEMLVNISVSDCQLEILTVDDKSYLNEIIDVLLNSGKFWQALRISRFFNHSHKDLETLVLCFSLAEGVVIPSQLSSEQRTFINKAVGLKKHKMRPYVSSHFSGSYGSKSFEMQAVDDFDTPFKDVLKILEILSEQVKNGLELAQKVFMTYRISINTGRRYHQILEFRKSNEFLEELLKEDCLNKLQVLHDFIAIWKWPKEEVADFVCQAIVEATDTFIQAHLEGTVLWDLDLDKNFQLILQVLPENSSSILGTKLYSYASALFKMQNIEDGEIKMSEIQLSIELLIWSHKCFTADCNMEGISVILRKCKKVISKLLEMKNWKSIVRLLTGIGRYTEMTYVFQILKENDHFEFLLRKGNRKDNGLKIALLEYLKKYCPENKELYKMVALHFTLYSEIANLWEEEANTLIRNLITISKLEMQNNGLNPEDEMFVLLSNTESTKMTLSRAMQNYTHAAEYHLHGEKLGKAMHSAKQAELIALQISLLKGIAINGFCNCLLNINNVQIGVLTLTQLSFPQSLILTEAYGYQSDWAAILYEQYIINNQQDYLDSFETRFPITDTLVHDVSRKFLSSNNTVSAAAIKNMKDMVSRLSSIHTKYRIASELGFGDLVEEMLAENRLTYLKDTVWKKGYRG